MTRRRRALDVFRSGGDPHPLSAAFDAQRVPRAPAWSRDAFAAIVGVVHGASLRRPFRAGLLDRRRHGRSARTAGGARAGDGHDRVRKPVGARRQQRGGARRDRRRTSSMLARPVSLHTLVVAARGLADAVTDPVGGLFLLPVLIAATVVWRLGAVAWPIAVAISVLMQIGISTLAYAVQLAVVRYVPGPPPAHGLDGPAAGRGAVARDAVDAGHVRDARAGRARRRRSPGSRPCSRSRRRCS